MGWADAGAAAGSGAAAGAFGGPVGALIGAGIGLFGSLFGAHEQASAASDAAKAQSDAARYAADVQAKAAAETLAYEKEQAAQTQANFERTQHANYDQWAARQGSINALGSLIGAPQRQIPGYVPTTTTSGAPQGSIGGAAGPATASNGDPVMDALLKNYQALGVQPTGPGTGPTDIAYMAKQARESLAAGERPLSYWLGPEGRVAQELAKAKGGAAMSAPQQTGAAPGSLGYAYLPFQAGPRPNL